MASVNLWSCVGSAGAVNPPDLVKIELAGSIAQLGGAGSVTIGSTAAVAVPGTGAGTQAVIRYGVTAIDGALNPPPNVTLGMFCRPGSGQVAARLVQVSIADPVSSVVETNLVEVEAQSNTPDLFTLQLSSDSGLLDLETNAYYVEVVLTALGNAVTEYPPAVSSVQLLLEQEASGGGGGSAGGGGGAGGGGVGGGGPPHHGDVVRGRRAAR
jgi:uncharacterized membrane protein YgcG